MPTTSADAAITKAATSIADQLGETKHRPRAQIWRIVRELGIDSAHALLAEVQTIEAGAGLLTPDGMRRRTPGGVFFWLASQRLSANARNRVFYYRQHVKQSVQATAAQASLATTALPASPPVTWGDRLAERETLVASPGEAAVSLTMIGHPIAIQDADAGIIVTLPAITLPPLPKGLPLPDGATIPAPLAFIASKHWKGKAAALTAPAAILILEGTCGASSAQGMTFLTMNATTKQRQQIKTTTTLKVTITGRPGTVSDKGSYVAMLLLIPRLPALPKGLPLPDLAHLPPVLVFIATKHWEAFGTVAGDDLLIQGFGIPDPDLPGLIVFATHLARRTAKPAPATV